MTLSSSPDQPRKPRRALPYRFEATPGWRPRSGQRKTRRRSDRPGATVGRFRTVGKACVFGSVAALRFVTQAGAAQADTHTGAAGLYDTAAVTAVVTARVERKLRVCELCER